MVANVILEATRKDRNLLGIALPDAHESLPYIVVPHQICANIMRLYTSWQAKQTNLISSNKFYFRAFGPPRVIPSFQKYHYNFERSRWSLPGINIRITQKDFNRSDVTIKPNYNCSCVRKRPSNRRRIRYDFLNRAIDTCLRRIC
jgi:hypothetical protein